MTATVHEPRGGLPQVVVTDAALLETVAQLTAGTGPVALDAERASGFRYRQRAYLIQLRRDNGGTHLIDPTAFDDLTQVQSVLHGTDWILHAASQDLVCLAELGLVPTAELFDTELAARLLGYPRVSLGALVEADLGIVLAKEHSAADWSKRPLPESWLRYAALDVEFLGELWDLLRGKLTDVGKLEWAKQEFAHVRDTTAPVVRAEPWRRTSGLHKVHRPSDLAVVRAVWHGRDAAAAAADIAPGRLLSDAAIIAMALSPARAPAELRAIPELAQRVSRRHVDQWVRAALAARELPADALPEARVRGTGLPAPRQWEARNPEAHARLSEIKVRLADLSQEVAVPVENLMTPELVRRVMWEAPASDTDLETLLVTGAARPWQRELVGPVLRAVLS